jgi:hypothetical protein
MESIYYLVMNIDFQESKVLCFMSCDLIVKDLIRFCFGVVARHGLPHTFLSTKDGCFENMKHMLLYVLFFKSLVLLFFSLSNRVEQPMSDNLR